MTVTLTVVTLLVFSPLPTGAMSFLYNPPIGLCGVLFIPASCSIRSILAHFILKLTAKMQTLLFPRHHHLIDNNNYYYSNNNNINCNRNLLHFAPLGGQSAWMWRSWACGWAEGETLWSQHYWRDKTAINWIINSWLLIYDQLTWSQTKERK